MARDKILDPSASVELQALAANIRLARKRRKLSLGDLAERSGVTASTLSRMERGDPTVAVGTVLQVLSVLGLVSGIAELTTPERDVAQTLAEVREIRLKQRRHKKRFFDEKELEF
jgi:transcriptional regulator with XRE-family HTH domain